MKSRNRLPVEDLRRLFRYTPETGEIYWNARTRMDYSTPPSDAVVRKWNDAHAGTKAFTRLTQSGYPYELVLGQQLFAHRVAFALAYGRHPADHLRHENGIRADVRIVNLREVGADAGDERSPAQP